MCHVLYSFSKFVLGRCLGLQVESFAFKPVLTDDMNAADLIITHCGAGTILEILRSVKKAVCVVNEKLMDNHQTELAKAMRDGSFMHVANRPSDLFSIFGTCNWNSIVEYPKPDSSLLVREIQTLVDI